MTVGITYDLRQDYLARGFGEEETAEFDREDTIEAIENALRSLGFDTDRIGNIESLTQRLANGHRWDLVFNIAEGLRGFGREAQVPALLDAYEIPYTFSDPLVLSLTLHKGMTKHVVRDLGIPTPAFYVVESESDISAVGLPYPLFAKPVAEGTGKGISAASKINNPAQLNSVCKTIMDTFKQPVLVESFLPGRELTVGIVGTGSRAKVLGVMEVRLRQHAEADAYSYYNKKEWEQYVEYHLVNDRFAKDAGEVALTVWRGLGCRDGGRIDMRGDSDDIPNFIEVNPLAGLNPDHSDLCFIAYKGGMTYQKLIERIIASAMERYGLKRERHEHRHRPQRTGRHGEHLLGSLR